MNEPALDFPEVGAIVSELGERHPYVLRQNLACFAFGKPFHSATPSFVTTTRSRQLPTSRISTQSAF